MPNKSTGKRVGRPAKTKSEKQKTGTFQKSREIKSSGKTIPLISAPDLHIEYPPAPDTLGPDGKKHWELIAKELTKLRIITSVDLFAMQAMCIEWECYLHHRRQQMDKKIGSWYELKGKNGTTYQPHPAHYNGTNHLREYTRLAQEFGLTPASRAAIGISTQETAKTKAAQLLKNAV